MQEIEQKSVGDRAGGGGSAWRRYPARITRRSPTTGTLAAPRPPQEISRGESPGEHGSGGEQGVRGESGGSGSEEASGVNLAPNETFDAVRGGAHLILNYDAGDNSFIGTVENTTANILNQVRVEVHLSNGTELGPTAPVDMAPGQVMMVKLHATPEAFTGWITHAEVGIGAEGYQAGGEHGYRAVGEHDTGGERRLEPVRIARGDVITSC